MSRPPRPRSEGVITRRLLGRAWGVLGLLSAALVLLAFFAVLLAAGWHRGDPVGAGSALHHAHRQATTATFAARTEWASLLSIGLTTNRLLLLGLLGEVLFTAAVVYGPPVQAVFGTAALPGWVLLVLLPFPVLVWGADEMLRALGRRSRTKMG
jgi:magnesium-transporting ATPase (P-type)